MTVRELKKLLKGVDDDMEVYLPLNTYFDGMFIRPSTEESGVAEFTMDPDSGITKFQFILVPKGYFDIDEEDIINPTLN